MEETKKKGRPSSYTQEIADKICEKIAQGKSLRTICEREEGHEEMPSIVTIFAWLRSHEDFLKQYARAKEQGSEALADEILDIADNGTNDWMEVEKGKGVVTLLDREHVERSKLRIESRKWLLAKLKPKKYGDKLDMTSDGEKMVIPILAKITHVSSNDSNKKNNVDVQENTGNTGGDVGKQDSIDTPLLDSLGAV